MVKNTQEAPDTEGRTPGFLSQATEEIYMKDMG